MARCANCAPECAASHSSRGVSWHLHKSRLAGYRVRRLRDRALPSGAVRSGKHLWIGGHVSTARLRWAPDCSGTSRMRQFDGRPPDSARQRAEVHHSKNGMPKDGQDPIVWPRQKVFPAHAHKEILVETARLLDRRDSSGGVGRFILRRPVCYYRPPEVVVWSPRPRRCPSRASSRAIPGRAGFARFAPSTRLPACSARHATSRHSTQPPCCPRLARR